MKLVAVILTLNEEQHLARCIASLAGVASAVVIADCFSTDATLAIASVHGVRVIQREWVNYATQFNWALTQLDTGTDWVLRIDADEVLTPELAAEINARLVGIGPEVDGVYCSRRMTFQGRLMRHGGIFPVRVLRLFRLGRGQCENRWMDEHIKVAGPTVDFKGELIDDNLNSLDLVDRQAQQIRQPRGGGPAEPAIPLHAARLGRQPARWQAGGGEALGERGGLRPPAGGL
jgi:glycosyltransferase involved in cell wall biosynthesis